MVRERLLKPGTAYAADYTPTTATIADEVTGAGGDLARHEVARFAENVPFGSFGGLSWKVGGGFGFVFTAESLLDQAGAVLEEVDSNLATCA